jgi:hypothetical protein
MITPITDHFAQAADKLIQRYKGKPRFAALLGTYIKQVQELEDSTWEVVASRDVDTADDVRLEILGRLIGQPRRAATTEQYRLYIKARIKVNRSDGAPETLKSIARLLLGQGTTLTNGDMWERLCPKGPIDVVASDPNVVTELLREAHTAGVGFSFEFFVVPASALFHFARTGAPLTDGRGFAKTDGTLGGVLTRIRT